MDLLTPKLEFFTNLDTVFDDKNHNDNSSRMSLRLKTPSIKLKTDKNREEETKATVKKYKKKRQQCPQCPMTYSKREYLSKHMTTEHNITLEKKRPGRQSQFRVGGGDDPRPYKCDQCVKEYIKSKHLARHRRTHLETKRCSECNEMCNNYADHMLKKHGIDLPRPFECDICHKTYRTKTHISTHMRIHRAASRIFACTVCPKTFFFATDLRKHVKTHSQNRSIICDICGDAFKSADTLKCHLRRHTGERPYKCSQCPRAFSTSNSLDIHMRTHTGERPFQCEFCQKRFSDSSTLLVHKRLHTNENPYMCHLCGRRTKQASNLRSHYKHFHKNNDISGRQIRSNSRIFSRFSQAEIDAELQQNGDLMALLERGLQDFNREETEKNSQIEKALKTIAPQGRPPTSIRTENTLKNENDNEIITADHMEVKVNVKEEETVQSSSGAVKRTRNTSTLKVKHDSPTISWSLPAETIPNINYSDDIKDIHLNNLDQHNIVYDPVVMPVDKDLLKIESVFIEDEPYRPPEIEGISIDDVKKEDVSDYDEFWAHGNYDDSSNEPFQIIKCESLADDATKKGVKITTKSSNKASNIVRKSNEIKTELLDVSIKNDDDETENDLTKTQSRSKSNVPKIEMERCIPCNRKFHDMAKHWVQFHSGIERPYECFICHKAYKRFEHLKYHMKTHGDERNYICHVCGDAFFLSNELRKHIMNRHQIERPFKCTYQQCKKCFKNQHALNVHMRTHSGIKPFVCAVCSEAFSALSSLKIHERKHTGDKPYVCKFCKKAFADCSTHRQHERIHTGEKPYRCHLCDRRTAQAGNLKSHYRHYHKIIVKSVSMYMDTNSSVPFTQERESYERNRHDAIIYPEINYPK